MDSSSVSANSSLTLKVGCFLETPVLSSSSGVSAAVLLPPFGAESTPSVADVADKSLGVVTPPRVLVSWFRRQKVCTVLRERFSVFAMSTHFVHTNASNSFTSTVERNEVPPPFRQHPGRQLVNIDDGNSFTSTKAIQ